MVRLWEVQWSYFTAFYFFFTSLTTIGLGDVTPETPNYIIFNLAMTLVGLSVVGLCIAIVQVFFPSSLRDSTGQSPSCVRPDDPLHRLAVPHQTDRPRRGHHDPHHRREGGRPKVALPSVQCPTD